jgi:hypothetical protein
LIKGTHKSCGIKGSQPLIKANRQRRRRAVCFPIIRARGA